MAVALAAGSQFGWAAQPFQESASQVVMEAEHYDSKIARNSHDWTLETAVAGFAAEGYVSALPNSGSGTTDSSYVTSSTELVFQVQFANTGTYHVWVRGGAAGGGDDSLHAGIDGSGPSTADRISSFTSAGWVWKRDTMDGVPATINIPTAGLHAIHLWMREDGLRVDRILLRKSSSATAPLGIGPAESPRSP